MSLDFNLRRIPNWRTRCFYDTGDRDERGRPILRLGMITDALIFLSVIIGLSSITKRNAPEFARRVAAYQRLRGHFLEIPYGQPYLITLRDIEQHIGLRTSASELTAELFDADLSRRGEGKPTTPAN